jgi:hypothetical protein
MKILKLKTSNFSAAHFSVFTVNKLSLSRLEWMTFPQNPDETLLD